MSIARNGKKVTIALPDDSIGNDETQELNQQQDSQVNNQQQNSRLPISNSFMSRIGSLLGDQQKFREARKKHLMTVTPTPKTDDLTFTYTQEEPEPQNSEPGMSATQTFWWAVVIVLTLVALTAITMGLLQLGGIGAMTAIGFSAQEATTAAFSAIIGGVSLLLSEAIGYFAYNRYQVASAESSSNQLSKDDLDDQFEEIETNQADNANTPALNPALTKTFIAPIANDQGKVTEPSLENENNALPKEEVVIPAAPTLNQASDNANASIPPIGPLLGTVTKKYQAPRKPETIPEPFVPPTKINRPG